jgi:hypothetical protein
MLQLECCVGNINAIVTASNIVSPKGKGVDKSWMLERQKLLAHDFAKDAERLCWHRINM